MNDEVRKAMEDLLKDADPALVEKFGNPLDETDPRNWTPSKRAEAEIDPVDRLRMLELDVEAQHTIISVMSRTLGTLVEYAQEQAKREITRLIEENPEQAIERLMELGETFGPLLGMGNGLLDALAAVKGAAKGSYGPLDNDPNGPVRYAGSSQGIAADQLVDTPDGLIRGDQIPGYVNDPKWKPSPDWMDANCMCPQHQARRAQDNGGQHTDPDTDFPTGFYL